MFSQVKWLYVKGVEGPVSLSVALAYADCFSGSGRFRLRAGRDRDTSGLKPITSACSRGFECTIVDSGQPADMSDPGGRGEDGRRPSRLATETDRSEPVCCAANVAG